MHLYFEHKILHGDYFVSVLSEIMLFVHSKTSLQLPFNSLIIQTSSEPLVISCWFSKLLPMNFWRGKKILKTSSWWVSKEPWGPEPPLKRVNIFCIQSRDTWKSRITYVVIWRILSCHTRYKKKTILKNNFFLRARKPPAETTLKQPIGNI